MQISSEGQAVTASLCILLIGLIFVEIVEASPVELENGKVVHCTCIKNIWFIFTVLIEPEEK